MPSSDHQELRRVGAETHARSNAAHASCMETDKHITSSRGAIARSLELLGRPFRKIDG
jgi:hypothetical protein